MGERQLKKKLAFEIFISSVVIFDIIWELFVPPANLAVLSDVGGSNRGDRDWGKNPELAV